MKISKTQLKEIIKEELEAVLSEEEETLEEIWPFGKKKKAAPEPEPEPEEDDAWTAARAAHDLKKRRAAEPQYLSPEEVRRNKEKADREFRIAQYQAYGDRDDKPKKSRAPAGGYGRYQGSGYGSPSAPWDE